MLLHSQQKYIQPDNLGYKTNRPMQGHDHRAMDKLSERKELKQYSEKY
jgi:hypothetical protein